MNLVPNIDLNHFLQGSEAERKQFIADFGKAYEEVGFVTVKNHGIPQELVNKFYQLTEQFFSMNTDTKKKYEIVNLAGQRGYTSFGREQAKGFDTPDLKEFWQFGQEVVGNDPIKTEYPENIEVAELPEFNQVGIDLYKAFEKSGNALLQAIALFLDLDVDYFKDKTHYGNSILRAIHYPPITSEPKSAIRAEQHEDINLITLLVGASADGLQILTRDNQWEAVKAPEGCIVVNVGDMLQRLSNDRLRSTTHRVVNPPRELWSTHRYSLPFFLHPRSEMDLSCLDSCISSSNPLKYEPITAGKYLEERLIEIGLLKK